MLDLLGSARLGAPALDMLGLLPLKTGAGHIELIRRHDDKTARERRAVHAAANHLQQLPSSVRAGEPLDITPDDELIDALFILRRR